MLVCLSVERRGRRSFLSGNHYYFQKCYFPILFSFGFFFPPILTEVLLRRFFREMKINFYCTYYSLFSSTWQKYYSVGMRRKRAVWSTWRRLRFWMKRNPCFWRSLQTLNITISIFDLISGLDSYPEWFSRDETCLEAIRAPLRRIGLYISHVPLSLVPKEVLIESKEHCSKYNIWRTNNGIGHYTEL